MRLTGNMVPHSYVLTSLHYGLAELKKKKTLLFCCCCWFERFWVVLPLAPLSRRQLERSQQETNMLVRVVEASEASVFEYRHLYNLNPSTDKQ